jgi:SAM-dependent methyltransferase
MAARSHAHRTPHLLKSTLPSATETIDCYNLLAEEYDSDEHWTTRELERLSGLGLANSSLFQKLQRDSLVVELGCGTGALSRQIAQAQDGGTLLLSDPAPQMLSQAANAVGLAGGSASVVTIRAAADELLARLTSPPDAIVAGLADPYLTDGLLKNLLGTCAPHTLIFVSVPSQRWAEVERKQRLQVPVGCTRFRMGNGTILYSRSMACDPGQLASRFTNRGLEVLDGGAVQADWVHLPVAPEVSWVLGRPLLTPARD